MNPYLKNESEEEQFDNTVAVALKLFKYETKSYKIAEKKLVHLGAISVRPLTYTIECALWDNMDDDDIDGRAEEASDIILKIGNDALPDLHFLATNPGVNLYVNDWAQDMIFKVTGAQGEEKQKLCHHFTFLDYSEEDKNILICPACDSWIPAEKNTQTGDE